MPVEEAGGFFFRLFGRFLATLFIEFLFEMVCYGVGFAFLRVVTVGSIPSARNDKVSDGFVSLTGALVIFAFCFWLVV